MKFRWHFYNVFIKYRTIESPEEKTSFVVPARSQKDAEDSALYLLDQIEPHALAVLVECKIRPIAKESK